MTDGRRAPHPANTLNELPGEEWLYFTKSLLTTAYPSELGHAARRAHGANKPPRLMARLIEFFSQTGELVLDPFAGVGGTLLGAAIARGPRRALGHRARPALGGGLRAMSCATCRPSGTAPGRCWPISVPPIRAARGRSTRPASRLRVGERGRGPADHRDGIGRLRRDGPAVQPPTADDDGRRRARRDPRNRRTDYAMVTESPDDLANAADYPAFLERMGVIFGELRRVLREGRYAVVIVRDAYQDGRYVFTGSDLAARAAAVGLVPKGDLIWYQAGTRLRPYGYPHAFVPNIVHQHILVLRNEAARQSPRRRRDSR